MKDLVSRIDVVGKRALPSCHVSGSRGSDASMSLLHSDEVVGGIALACVNERMRPESDDWRRVRPQSIGGG
jgi:hypothetical protein